MHSRAAPPDYLVRAELLECGCRRSCEDHESLYKRPPRREAAGLKAAEHVRVACPDGGVLQMGRDAEFSGKDSLRVEMTFHRGGKQTVLLKLAFLFIFFHMAAGSWVDRHSLCCVPVEWAWLTHSSW